MHQPSIHSFSFVFFRWSKHGLIRQVSRVVVAPCGPQDKQVSYLILLGTCGFRAFLMIGRGGRSVVAYMQVFFTKAE